MGFFNKNRFLQLPNKRMVDDMIEREGPPTSESFTPFIGKRHLIKEQMVGQKWSTVGIEVIKSEIPEFRLSKVNGNSEVNDIGSINSIDYSSMTLEEFNAEENSDDILQNYITSQLIGFKVNSKSEVKNVMLAHTSEVQNMMYDSETNEVYNLSNDYVEESSDSYAEEYFDMKRKIPYLLKKLQDGSIFYGVSLLSLFIARDYIINHYGKREEDIKPSDLLSFPIYIVDATGELWGTFDPAKANTEVKFIRAKEVILGNDKANKFYRAGVELTNISRKLGYNLYEESIEDYRPSIINNIMCNYIVSNKDVLLDIGAGDPRILKMLNDGSLFKVIADSTETHKTSNILELRNMARNKMNEVPILIKHIEGTARELVSVKATEQINYFIKLYKEEYPSTQMEENELNDCMVNNNVICNESGTPILFNISKFVTNIKESPGFKSVYGIVTKEGIVIRVDSNTSMRITNVANLLRFYLYKDVNSFYVQEVSL